MKKNQQKGRDRFLIYGRRVVEEFLHSSHDPRSVKKIYYQKSSQNLVRKLREKCKKAEFFELQHKEMETLLEGHHQGLILEFAPEGFPSYSSKSPPSVLHTTKGPYLCLDRIQDVQNLGAIFRTAEALGVSNIFLSPKCAPVDARAHRAASGASLHLSIYEAKNLNRLFAEAKKAGLWIVSSASQEDCQRLLADTLEDGLHGHSSDKTDSLELLTENFNSQEQKQKSLILKEIARKKGPLFLRHTEMSALPDTPSLLLVIGNEGTGIQPLLIKNSDYLVSIQLQGKTSSLNAGVAAGILLDRIINR